MPSQGTIGLDVEDESGRRPFCPEGGGLLRRYDVVARVHFGDVELRGVKA